MLIHSRPYDAAVLGLATVALAWLLRKQRPTVLLTRIALPAFAVLAISLAAVAYTDYRVTGNALALPYQAHDRQYAVAGMFCLGSPGTGPFIATPSCAISGPGWDVDLWKDSRSLPVEQFLGKAYI